MSAPKVDVLAVLDAEIRARDFGPSGHAAGCVEHPPGFSTRCNCHGPELRAARAAVAELIEAARRLQLDRAGIANAEKSDCKLVAPMLDLQSVLAFNAALARVGGAA